MRSAIAAQRSSADLPAWLLDWPLHPDNDSNSMEKAGA
jgi:hypothetical protein